MAEPRDHRSTTQRTPGARLDPAVRRAQIVQAAASVFHGRDPASVSFEQVAEAAGVSRSLVYAYFGDRAGLIAAVYQHDLEELDAELWDAVPRQWPDEVQLRRIVGRFLRYARDHPASWNLITAASSIDHPAIRAARRERIEQVVAPWGSSPEARLAAQAVLGLLEAAADEWAHGQELDLERAVEVVGAVLWAGIQGLERTVGTPDG